MTRSAWLWPIVITLSALSAGLLVFADIQSPLRAPVIWWFLFVCPGMAFVRALRFEDRIAAWSLAIALSLTLDALVAGALLYAGRWSPPIGLAVLIGLSLIGVVLQLSPVTDRLKLLQRQALRQRSVGFLALVLLVFSIIATALAAFQLAASPLISKPASAYQAAVMADRPVSYWRLNEASGETAVDMAGPNLGTLRGEMAYSQPGALATDLENTSLGFNGANTLVSVLYNENLDIYGDFTVEAWAKPDLLDKAQTVLHKGRSPNSDAWHYRLALTGRNFWRGSVRVGGKTYELTHTEPASLDRWAYLVLTRRGETLTFYVDATAVATATVAGDFSPSTGYLAIGRTGTTSGGYFTGDIDEVAIYHDALSAERVAAHYRASGVVNPAPTLTPTATLRPTRTPQPTRTPAPTKTATPTRTPAPTRTPSPTATFSPTSSSGATQTRRPTNLPSATRTIRPSATPSPTKSG